MQLLRFEGWFEMSVRRTRYREFRYHQWSDEFDTRICPDLSRTRHLSTPSGRNCEQRSLAQLARGKEFRDASLAKK